MPRVLIGPSTFAATDPAPLRRLREAGLDVIPNPVGRKLTGDELRVLLEGDVIGLIAGLETLDHAVLKGSRLRAVSRCGAGVSNVDLDAAAALGIAVHSTPDAPSLSVAELTVGAMLTLVREVRQMDAALHGGAWQKRIGRQLTGRAVAIIGFGRIGREVARLLEPFSVRLLVVDPALGEAAPGFQLMSLDDAVSTAEIITLHCSGSRTVLDRAAFARMRGVFLLNGARGSLVDEAALCEALDDGRVAGAWFDAFAEEPYAGPLVTYPQVLLTPHVGSYTAECRQRMEMEAVDNLLSSLRPAGGHLQESRER